MIKNITRISFKREPKSISSIIEYYAAGSSKTDVPSEWSTVVPELRSETPYLWNYERVLYSDGSVYDSPPSVRGVYGKGIQSIVDKYLATSLSSGVTRSTSGWTTGIQNTTSIKKYLWNYETIVYNDDTEDYVEPHIIGTYGDKGDDGISMVPLYRNSDIAPAKPTGDILPPDGWRTDPENNVAVEIEINSELSDHEYELTTENYEYETPYYVLATENVSFAEEEDADGKLCIAAKVKLTTSMQNQQVQIEVISSSESNYDCGFIGLLDNNTIPSRLNADTYKTKVSGKEVTAVAMIDIPAAGDHFVNIFYIKDNTRSEYDDKIWFRIKPLPQTMWMSIAQVKNEAVQSYTTPIAITAARGPQGARTNVTTYKANTLYYAGNFGEPVLDIVYYNGRYYRCMKTHISAEDLSNENPYDEVMHGYNTWSLESNQEFIATKVLFAGDVDN